jgi:hypothetical protein
MASFISVETEITDYHAAAQGVFLTLLASAAAWREAR